MIKPVCQYVGKQDCKLANCINSVFYKIQVQKCCSEKIVSFPKCEIYEVFFFANTEGALDQGVWCPKASHGEKGVSSKSVFL